MDTEEPFINNDVFNIRDIAEIEGEFCCILYFTYT